MKPKKPKVKSVTAWAMVYKNQLYPDLEWRLAVYHALPTALVALKLISGPQKKDYQIIKVKITPV